MRPTSRRIVLFFCLMFPLAVLANVARAQTITVLHNFTLGADGGYPQAGLTMDAAGNLYGTTYEGGADGGAYGVVFRLSRSGSGWILTTLHQFQGPPDGDRPTGGVILGPDGSLYGTTDWGGQYNYGTVYRLRQSCRSATCPWEETVLYSFCAARNCADGKNPSPGNLVFDHAGNLYGTTVNGGSATGPLNINWTAYGTVFELTPSNGGWTENVLWSFTQTAQGLNPFNGVIFDNAGNLYGTTCCSAEYLSGSVFKLSPTGSGSGWIEQTLAPIDFPHTTTAGGVVMDGQGNLFGTSGCEDGGGVFELTPSNGSWTFNVLHAFNPGDQAACDTPTLDAAGNVYGTSSFTGLYNKGEVFKLTPSNGGWIYSSVSFDGTNGESPTGSVILDAAGNIYGTTYLGGTGAGTVWEITP